MDSNGIRYVNDGSSTINGITVNTPYENRETSVSVESFLQLMIAQITNQDFFSGDSNNGSSTTDYITQLAQISTMQQMQELAYYQKTNYVMSLVGKEVTVASLSIGGGVNKTSGTVERVTLTNNEYQVYVGGKSYELSQIQEVRNPDSTSNSLLAGLEKSAIIPMNVTSDSISLRFNPPNVSAEELNGMTYQVYYSDSTAMDTLAQVSANGKRTAVMTKADNYMTSITGLEAGKTYFVNVVATTKDGDSNVYQKMTVSTNPL